MCQLAWKYLLNMWEKGKRAVVHYHSNHLELRPELCLPCVLQHTISSNPTLHYVEVALWQNHPGYHITIFSSEVIKNDQEALWISTQSSETNTTWKIRTPKCNIKRIQDIWVTQVIEWRLFPEVTDNLATSQQNVYPISASWKNSKVFKLMPDGHCSQAA